MKNNKKAVVTGATKGIGRAIAEAFAQEGFDIAICARTSEDLTHLEKDFKTQYPHIQVVTKVADMRKKKDVLAFADFVKEKFQAIDVLINNAGVFIPGAIATESEGKLEMMIETNLYSAYYMTRALLPSIAQHQKAHIFNICSVASLQAYPNGGSYSISKFALLGFSKVLREELKKLGIRVTAVMPGATWSDSWAGVDLPESRLMQASDVANAIVGVYRLSDVTVVEELILRPQLGDL